MNLHFFMDPFGFYSQQFASRAERIDPGNNLIVNINEARITHPSILYFKGYDKTFKKWLSKVDQPARVYYHFYNPIFQDVNLKLKRKFPELLSVWSFWGGDFYSLPEFREEKYLEFSTKNSSGTVGKSSLPRKLAVEMYYRLKGNVPYNHKRFIDSFKKIEYLATCFRQDYENVVSYSNVKMRFHKFQYLSLDLILGDVLNWNITPGEKIMVGHSADPGLNHFEILQKLSANGVKNTVLLPLHYGDPVYRENLLKAVSGLNLDTEVIKEYMALPEYNKKLQECGFAIFNVPHQQALGNIITLLWLGVKVFLHESSAIYQEFISSGMHLFSINDLSSHRSFEPLTDMQAQENRALLENLFSKEITDRGNLALLRLERD